MAKVAITTSAAITVARAKPNDALPHRAESSSSLLPRRYSQATTPVFTASLANTPRISPIAAAAQSSTLPRPAREPGVTAATRPSSPSMCLRRKSSRRRYSAALRSTYEITSALLLAPPAVSMFTVRTPARRCRREARSFTDWIFE